MYRLLPILSLLLFTTLLSETSASLTLLITGHSGVNVDKQQLARQFVASYDEIIKGSPPKLLVFTNGVAVPVAVEERHVHGIWDDVNLAGNVTTVIVTNLSFNEMNSDQLIIMQRLIKTTASLVVVEFGSRSNETRDLLDEAAICLLSGRIANASPNVVYFCNNAAPAMFSNLQIDNLREITPSELNNKPSDLHRPTFWPWFFVSAVKEHRHYEHHHHHHHGDPHHHHHHGDYQHYRRHHFDEDVDEIVDQIMEDIAEQRPVVTEPEKEPNAYQKKLGCKYRKSCYDTGVVPDIETVFTRFVKRWWPHWLETEDAEKQEDETEEDTGKPYDSEEDLLPQKVRCKYRISCYQEHGIPFDEKAEERRKVLLSSKRVVQSKGQKKTLKEIAAHTLKKVQEAEEKAAKRPVVKVVEKRLNAIEEKLSEKLNCKYRKSCYETGQKPVIADGWSLPLPIKIFSTESAEAATKEINYDELEELEKKVYCKYRKSCYETGIRPDFEPEIFVGTFRDLFTIHEQVEPRKVTMQEKCKYRKSCYETGIVPEINPKLEEAIHKEVSPVIPTNAQDLRLLCKYRKSCYAEIHDSATVDTIKFIRKRRQIEKEVRRRRAKRAKLHRRFRGELQLDSYRRHHRRDKTVEEEQPEQKEQQPEEPEEVEDFVDVKIIPPKRGRKEKVKEKREEVVEEVPVKATKSRKTKQPQKIESEEDEAIEEPVPIPVTETEKDETPPAKKPKKGKKAKTEAPKAEKQLEKEQEEDEERKEKKPTTPKLPKKKEVEPKPKDPAAKQKKKEEKEKAKEKQKREDAEQAVYAKQAGSKPFDTVAAGVRKMMEDMHIQQEEQDKKEYCKYRKSCYKSGKRPKIDQTIQHLLDNFSEHVDQELERRDAEAATLPKTELGKKLECKYRKSCYETGVLPEIVVPHYFYNDQKIVFKAGVSKQLQCKYRKSCYAETGLSPEKEDLKDSDEKREPAKVAGQQAKQVPVSKDSREDKEGARRSIRTAQTGTGPAARTTDKETQDVECKSGGKSCYTSAEPQTMNEDHAGSMARIGLERYRKDGWCNKYYYSCRAILGLPPKERAPIGPNGKRLCRKKPL